MRRFFLLLVLLATSYPGRAQDASMQAALPDSIVVTASRQAEAAQRTGRRVAVWTAQDVARLPVTSFDELLRTVAGVEVQSRGGFGVQSDLTVRGSSFNGVLVLLDGARFNDPMTGHFLSDFPIPLADIARVEVLRGPASALYGPDALGGVIQVFTYAGLQAAALPAATRAYEAGVQRGAHGLIRLDGGAHAGTGPGFYSAAATHERSDGMAIRDAQGRPMVGSRGAVRTDFTRTAATTAMARRTGWAALYARAGYDERDFGAYHFYTGFASDTAREATSTLWAQLRLQDADAPDRWQVHVSARRHEDTYVYNPRTPANQHVSRQLTAHLQSTRRLGVALLLTGGLAGGVRGIDSNNLGRHDDASAGAFALARLQATPDVTLHGGARLDYDPGYGVAATPQASLAYVRPAYTLRAAAGRAVRAPDYVERYINTTLARPRGRNLGHPDLRPERAWSFEAGADLHPGRGLSAHATVFTRHTDDLIDYARAPADTVWLARNLHEVQTRGVELEAAWHQTREKSRLRLAAAYTYLDANLGAVPGGTEYKYALTHARHLLQGTALLDLGAVHLGLQGLWKERLTGPSYGLADARLGYVLAAGRYRVVLSGELRNVFDVQYTDVFDAPMPGRWWLLGVRLAR